MVFRKLFHLLVVGGAVIGATSGCTTPARDQMATDKTGDASDGGAASRGTGAKAPDSNRGAPDPGGGVSGW
jgi:hypothetical protein